MVAGLSVVGQGSRWTMPLLHKTWEDLGVNLRRRGWDGDSMAARRYSGAVPREMQPALWQMRIVLVRRRAWQLLL